MSEIQEAVEQTRAERLRSPRRFGISIQSKLLLMMLVTALITALVVGIIGVVNGRQSLLQATQAHMTSIREMRAHEIEQSLTALQQYVVALSERESVIESTKQFDAAWDELEAQPLAPEREQALGAFYDDVFIPALEERSGADFDKVSLLPHTDAGKYLQSVYTASTAESAERLAITDPGDGSTYSRLNAQYQHIYKSAIESLGYQDLLVANEHGDIVYSAYKGEDLGISLTEGAYANSLLTDAFQRVMTSGSSSVVITTDFERWQPSENRPNMWVVSSIADADGIYGALIVQVPMATINDLTTAGGEWEEQGFGDTGEVYLVGTDDLMRSNSRLLLDDPEEFARRSRSAGTATATVDQMQEHGGSILLQPIVSSAVEAAQRGESGVTVNRDYLGGESVSAYQPLQIGDLDWVIVARSDTSEAYAAVNEFTRNLILSALALLLLVSLAALLLAQTFSRPIRRLAGAVREVAAGDYAVRAPVTGRDEVGDLGSAFNDMAESLQFKQQLLEEEKAENDRIMRTLMPEEVAERYRAGEDAIAQSHKNVSVMFAELTDFDDYARDLSEQEEITALNELMRLFDEAAKKTGVESVRTLRGGYLASSGLMVPRVDAVRRAVQFAREMRAAVGRFNDQHGASIDLRAGVDSGTVTSGVVSRASLAYDLWGDAVNLSQRVRTVTTEPGVYVSDAVHGRLQETVGFEQVGTLEVDGTEQAVWRVIG
ncbi:adenylate/guanylate cyclase domain-containing protein [Microbacterium sp. AK031]|uniref:adenylate/guanylate cyclase domain-containing protein n=1 Tax=Microbacterium sp. AK031 TaxID=2723076 RepID=UPI0021672961|nr:adenylate/guanylate cyclase domain-containing protein [Microbacterium sp. AK031]MCS3844957.1 class 3 adenylate cyclase/cell division protein FtsL [Microbacterium sp. AK031]